MKREYYSDSITDFLDRDESAILGQLSGGSSFPIEPAQFEAWREQIRILKPVLTPHRGSGRVYFEYSIPRLGKRIDVLALIGPVIFVLEFKTGESHFSAHALDQVWDYGLDLKNFHESSHHCAVVPVLIATAGTHVPPIAAQIVPDGDMLRPIQSTPGTLPQVFEQVLARVTDPAIDSQHWEAGRYCPTPTIIEAATALYGGHGVAEISRRDAGATNLTQTSDAISQIIRDAKTHPKKVLCFVTGVPGAGKTLVGLNIATQHIDQQSDPYYSVFLSGNGPLVNVLCEALTRDKVHREKERGRKVKKGATMSEVQAFIQNVHHFRDDCLVDTGPPVEHVALFDEAQRAWDLKQTCDFMRRKKKRADFNQSEPQFLISCLDRHRDWAVIVCLVGGGQEINTGEAGIAEWIKALTGEFADWHIRISSRLTDSEYAADGALEKLNTRPNVEFRDDLHLGVSMRSFRAENVSLLVKQLLDLDTDAARRTLTQIHDYPIVLTRDLPRAKQWLKDHARGSERYGIVVSSQAERLKPHAIDVKSPMDPVHWFLDGKEDVRSSYYLEDVATEFDVQGLELDWACVTWDADFRHTPTGWDHWSFCGSHWNRIKKDERQKYLKNAYRVLLTRARQGMVIVVPEGDPNDPTRRGEYYDPTFEYLRSLGVDAI